MPRGQWAQAAARISEWHGLGGSISPTPITFVSQLGDAKYWVVDQDVTCGLPSFLQRLLCTIVNATETPVDLPAKQERVMFILEF